MAEFYWSISGGSTYKALEVLPMDPNVLVSAGLYYYRASRCFHRANIPSNAGKIMVDSGAQQFNTRFKSYPYGTDYYIHFAKRLQADFIVSLDVPCDFVVARKEMTVDEALEITVKNAENLFDAYHSKGRAWECMPILVIQGYELEDFLRCLEMYKDLNLLEKWDYWGIGSLCLERSPDKVYEVCRAIRKEVGWKKWLHVFGPNTRAMKKIWRLVNSVDSAVWHTVMKPGSLDPGMKCSVRYFHRGRWYEFFPRKGSEKRYPSIVLKEICALEFLKFLKDLEKQQALEGGSFPLTGVNVVHETGSSGSHILR